MVFDVQCVIHTIGWLSFLLSNMYVKFGDQICCQVQGTPMVTDCASHLADSCLAVREVSFITQSTWLHCTSMLLLLSCAQSSMQWHVPLCLLRYIDDLASICSANLHHKLCVDQNFHHARITGLSQDSVGHARQIHETPATT